MDTAGGPSPLDERRPAQRMTDEWIEWHRGYSGNGLLARRLEVVRNFVREALDRCAPGPVRVISMCAGDGRDLLGVRSSHPRGRDVHARLVELAPELVAAGREQVVRHGLAGVEFVLGDASTTDAYSGKVPSDIVLVCGVFGNVTDADVRNTIEHLPELCATHATVIWTRGRFAPDLTPTIREWFGAAGFTEISFAAIPDTTAAVGAHRLTSAPRPFRAGERLFTFLPQGERPSSRGTPAVGREVVSAGPGPSPP